jgi:hypothetical protein
VKLLNLSLAGISDTRAYVSSAVPSTAGPNFTMNGSPGNLIEETVSNNVNSEVVTQTATVPAFAPPDFTIPSGSTGIVLLTTYPSTSNLNGESTIGTIDLSNGATESVNHEYNTDISFGGLVTNRNYSPGRYTLSWSNSGSTASEASFRVGGVVTFDPRNNRSWILEVT